MRDQITGRLQWLQRSFGSFTAGQKVVAVIGGLALVLGAVMVFRWASAPSYAPLFTNMAPADASAVVDKLNSAGTPYELADSGTTVLVPQNDVYDARIKLSGEGLPSQSSEGYGLLDKQGLSTSQFQEQTTFKRATEGELEKTISALDPVNAAIVHIAMPQEQLFSTDQQPTTASVLVQTQPGSTLTTEQVQAIVHLVSSSVTGLDPKNVTVTDSAGNVLSTAGDDQYAEADTRTQQVQAFEDRMSTNVTSMLDRIVGPGNSTTQVTADLNFDKAAFRTTRYFTKPKPLPLSLSKSSEKYAGAAGTAGGVVGPDGQLDPTATTGTVGTPGSKYGKKQETLDNAISNQVEQREVAPGGVQAIHAAVVIDTQSLKGSTPNQVQQALAAAMGINPKRGDTLDVQTMPFDRTQQLAAAAALATQQKADAKAAMMSNIKTGGLAGVVLLSLLVAWLRGRKRRKVREEATNYVVEQIKRKNEPTPALPPSPSAAELEAGDPSDLRSAAREEISAMVERQPEEVAQLLRGWLVESDR
ncbi:MAG TPA: flagellar basal-body MS-ring/collar protein FliF [Nocardioidaceae bacterium]|jgi:flagellar M-ring protein FliF|nr:flagellar basal-body MS-ring/collar protein FliF [Nocardioidaceae bacterium]